jgi:hypothetical protein
MPFTDDALATLERLAARGRSFRLRPLTTAASSLAILVTVAALTMDTRIARLDLGLFEEIEGSEVAQVAAAWLVVFVAFRIDQISAARAKRLHWALAREAEAIRVVHVTMRTVSDIVGNCLTELQLLRMEAEGKVSPEVLELFDHSIRVASERLTAIGNLEAFAEKEMALGAGLDMDEKW